ncbi:FAD:protein FMN transferase [Shewanella mangrovisoli]|uniref:FAD:protein FMN transferase n=1 Tax=Shewanella mangrovisoli TaxID=2864211 RepID=UPI0035BA34AB
MPAVSPNAPYRLVRRDWGFLGEFRAMASPCELLIASHDEDIAYDMLDMAAREARRIEQKYSRFIEGNYLWRLNHADGKRQSIDEETWQLLAFAKQCFELSDGLFDISACPLMQVWRFTQDAKMPAKAEIEAARALVGFARIEFNSQELLMPQGMQLDVGGIAKEYAVDRVAYELAESYAGISVLVNFGGDIACPVANAVPWQVGIEDPHQLDHAAKVLAITQGALATSGDTRRFIEVEGKRYGHIVDPRTGYPVSGAPRSVTVLGPNCVTAGMLATMAMLQGEQAEAFLAEQSVQCSIFR